MSSNEPYDSGRNEDVSPYRVLDTSNRRSAGVVYLVFAAVGALIVLDSGLSSMWVTAVIPLVAVAGYQFLTGMHMAVSDMKAIEIAYGAAPFDTGHGSATLGFNGPRARPVWQVLVFESTPFPEHQALVTVDALSGEVTGVFSEAVEVP